MALQKCQNLRSTPDGLCDFIDLNQPMSDAYLTSTLGGTKAWPFPQLFVGKKVSLLCFETSIYTVTEASGAWTAAAITVKNAADLTSGAPATLTISSGGGAWQFVDFWDFWMLFNEKVVIFKAAFSSSTWGTEAVTMRTGCNWYDGRVVIGGFNAANIFALSNWPSVLTNYDNDVPTEISTLISAVTQGADKNWLWHSSVGGDDVLHFFNVGFFTSGSIQGTPNFGYSSTYPQFFDYMARGDSGFFPMPWAGPIACVKGLGEGFVVYGREDTTTYKRGGVTGCYPVDTRVGRRDIQDLSSGVSIASRGAVGGNEKKHLMIDESGFAWLIGSDFKAIPLDYEEFFENLVVDDIVISHDEHRDEFYIADGVEGWLLNGHGLSRAPWMPTTVHFARGGLQSIYFAASYAPAVVIKSHPVRTSDSGRQINTVTYATFKVTQTAGGLCTVKLGYRLRQQDNWTETAGVAIDTRGTLALFMPCAEFYWILEAADRATVVYVEATFEVEAGVKAAGRHWLDAANPSAATIP